MTFTDLPIDITLEVVSYLTAVDVVSLLEAVPSLKAYAVVVTSQCSYETRMQPTFFTIEGVTQRVFQGGFFNLCKTHKAYNPLTDRMPIKLLEVDYDYFKQMNTSLFRGGCGANVTKWLSLPLDATTFVFLYTDNGYFGYCLFQSWDTRDSPFEHVDEFTLTKIHCGVPWMKPFKESDTFLRLSGNPEIPIKVNSTLNHIHISNQLHVKDLDLPKLRSLVVHFPKTTPDRPTSLLNINVPAIIHFSISYYDTLPTIRGIRACSGSTIAVIEHDREIRYRSQFELTNLSAAQCTRVTVPIDPQQAVEYNLERAELELEFTRGFSTMFFNGVPQGLLSLCDLTKVKRLMWVASLNEVITEPTPMLYAPWLSSLIVVAVVPEVKLPRFAATSSFNAGELADTLLEDLNPECVKISELVVLLLAPRVDMSAFNESILSPRHTRIYRSPCLLYHHDAEKFELDLERWRAILRRSTHLSMVGFQMDFLSDPNSCPLIQGVFSAQQHFQLNFRPYVKDPTNVVIHIPHDIADGDHELTYKDHSLSYTVHPIIDPAHKINDFAGRCIDVHVRSLIQRSVVEISPGFETYKINGEVQSISLMDSTSWKKEDLSPFVITAAYFCPLAGRIDGFVSSRGDISRCLRGEWDHFEKGSCVTDVCIPIHRRYPRRVLHPMKERIGYSMVYDFDGDSDASEGFLLDSDDGDDDV